MSSQRPEGLDRSTQETLSTFYLRECEGVTFSQIVIREDTCPTAVGSAFAGDRDQLTHVEGEPWLRLRQLLNLETHLAVLHGD